MDRFCYFFLNYVNIAQFTIMLVKITITQDFSTIILFENKISAFFLTFLMTSKCYIAGRFFIFGLCCYNIFLNETTHSKAHFGVLTKSLALSIIFKKILEVGLRFRHFVPFVRFLLFVTSLEYISIIYISIY